MGRRRIKFGEQRQPISVSLPRSLIMDLDRTLPEEHSRSRLFEKLLKKHLETNTKLTDFRRHAYECHDCGRKWHQNRHIDVDIFFCSGKTGCGSGNIEYIGIYEEEEE